MAKRDVREDVALAIRQALSVPKVAGHPDGGLKRLTTFELYKAIAEAEVKATKEEVKATLTALVKADALSKEGVRRGCRYFLPVAPYEVAEEAVA